MGSNNSKKNPRRAQTNTLREYIECSRANPSFQAYANNNSATFFSAPQVNYGRRRTHSKLKTKFPTHMVIPSPKLTDDMPSVYGEEYEDEYIPITHPPFSLQMSEMTEESEVLSDSTTSSDCAFREESLAEFSRLVKELEQRDNLTSIATEEAFHAKIKKQQNERGPTELRLWIPEEYYGLFTHRHDRRVSSIARACLCSVELTGMQRRCGRRSENMTYEVAIMAGCPNRLTQCVNVLTEKFAWFRTCDLVPID